MTATPALTRVLDALGATTGHHPRGGGRQYYSRCPAHPDNNPSLSITDSEDRVLVKCQAGCATDDILAQLNLTYADLFHEQRIPDRNHTNGHRTVVAEYPYRDEEGNLLYVAVRYQPKDFRQKRPDSGGWAWNMQGVRRVPYRLPELIQAVAEGRRIYVTEGEKDADRITNLGHPATCNVGGAGKWRDEYAAYLAGATVTVIADADIPGRAHADQVAASLRAAGAAVTLAEPATGKDVSDHLDAGRSIDDLVHLPWPTPDGTKPPRNDTANHKSPQPSVDLLLDPRTAPREIILNGLLDEPEHATWDDEPEKLDGEGDPPQPFPVEALPRDLAEYCAAVAETTQTPPAMAGMLMLSALSTAAANRYWVARESHWIEPLVIWTLTALPPGSRKSAVSSHVSRPLYVIERDIREAHSQETAGKEDLLAVANKRKERILNDLVKTRTPSERLNLEADLDAARAEIEALTIPPARQLLCDDITPEALGVLLSENDGHIGIMSTEGGVFASISGRYTQGTPQLDLILKSYDGDPYRANRIGRAKVILDHPSIVLGLAVQPHVLATDTTKNPALRERGLMGRFTYAIPADTVGTRAVITQPVPNAVDQRWHKILTTIAETPICANPSQERRLILLDPEALELHREYQRTLEPRLHEQTGDLAFMSDWAGKHVGRILRVASLLHLATGGTEHDQIDAKAMTAAIELGEWMLNHAVAVYGGWRAPEANTGPVAVLNWIRRTARTDFTAEQVRTALRGQRWCANADAVKRALVVLVRAGWLTSCRRLMADGKRKTAAIFIPHPSLLAQED